MEQPRCFKHVDTRHPRSRPWGKSARIAFPPSLYKSIKLPGNAAKFDGFDRTPYVASFKIGKSSIVLVNVHLFFGSAAPTDMARRALEALGLEGPL